MQIEKGIPVPLKKNWQADLDKMEVNDSSLIDMESYNSVRATISQYFHKETLKKFTTAKEIVETDKGKVEKFRVWRVA